MNRFVLIAAFAALSAGCLAADEKALKDLEGTYAVASLNRGGTDLPAEAKDASVKFDGATMTVTVGERTYAAKVKVDPAKSPATIDISPADGKEKGKTFPGVYALSGGELTLAFAEEGPRPKEPKAGAGVTLMKLKKQK
jgi:uncharacterized protein (TIGR03067 family)